MSWSVTEEEHLRLEFVMIARDPLTSISKTCQQFGISRKTGYKWLERFGKEGLKGLANRSSRPHTSPISVSGEVVMDLVKLRNEHPFWGPKKLRELLLRKGTREEEIPSVASIGRILKRTGLSESKGRGRPRVWRPDKPLRDSEGPNQVWTVDLKGWWRTGDGLRCEPLTIRDLFSRYLLCVRPMTTHKTEAVRSVFEEVFERYGLPKVIRSDNGSPFASMTGPHGLTRLSAWWRSIGIELDRIEPGHPEQNGGHERMHADIQREIASQPSSTLLEESKRLERWRIEYNIDRPHEGLGMKTPGKCYRCSPRRLGKIDEYSYPDGFECRKVTKKGFVKFKRHLVFVSEALKCQKVGLERIDDTSSRLWFCDLEIGKIDYSHGAKFRPTAST